jgi:hypothetical protein
MSPPAKIHAKCPVLDVAGVWTSGLAIAFIFTFNTAEI